MVPVRRHWKIVVDPGNELPISPRLEKQGGSDMQARRFPNLFIIGAMKSGTTSLHNYLNEHPQVFMCEPKEPGFFVDELSWSRGFAWYNSLFSGVKDEAVVGESSTHYTKLPVYRGVVEKIAKFNPDARFIYLMRDPFERLVSHYWHNVRDLQWVGERRDMLTAVKRDSQYIGFSDYAMQLKPYFDLFGYERVYTLTFEAMVGAPQQTVLDIFQWFGLGGEFLPSGLKERWNVMPEDAMKVRGLGILNRLRYTALWDRLAPIVPKGLRQLVRNAAEQPLDKSAQPIEAVEDYVRPIFKERTEELKDMLKRDFPEWKKL